MRGKREKEEGQPFISSPFFHSKSAGVYAGWQGTIGKECVVIFSYMINPDYKRIRENGHVSSLADCALLSLFQLSFFSLRPSSLSLSKPITKLTSHVCRCRQSARTRIADDSARADHGDDIQMIFLHLSSSSSSRPATQKEGNKKERREANLCERGLAL